MARKNHGRCLRHAPDAQKMIAFKPDCLCLWRLTHTWHITLRWLKPPKPAYTPHGVQTHGVQINPLCIYIHTYIQFIHTIYTYNLYIQVIHTIYTYHFYIHTCIHACMHAYIHTDTQTDRHTYVRTYVRTYIQTHRQTDIHTYVRTYIHVCMYVHAYRSILFNPLRPGIRPARFSSVDYNATLFWHKADGCGLMPFVNYYSKIANVV